MRTRTAALLLCGFVVFAVLATANSGGYRYGISDQAFYEPAVRRALDPSLFAHDAPLLATESHLLGSDKIIAGAARLLHVDLPPVFFAIYAISLLTLAIGAVAFARALKFDAWTTAAFLLLLTLRHRIARTGANTLEGYMHPRELAFAIGTLGAALIARRRVGWAAVCVAVALLLHLTTGFWFALLIGAAAFVVEPRARRWLVAGLAIGCVAVLVTLWTGVLAPRLVAMDPAWLAVLADKDYVLPTEWPLYAWAINLLYLPVLWLTLRRRERLGLAAAGERALVWGAALLTAVFLVSLPCVAARVALAVQAQVPRVFWMVDWLTMAAVAWWLTAGLWRSPGWRRRGAVIAVVALGVFSAARGAYALEADHQPLVQVQLAPSPWVDALRWIAANTPRDTIVLADPDHAWKEGTSVRVGAQRDTVLERIKDSALAMYDRPLAMRVAEREAALDGFPRFSTADVERVAARFGASVAILPVTQPLALPALYRNAGFVVYRTR